MTQNPAYTIAARWYDALSLEWPVYRPGRVHAIKALALNRGDRVLDVGCGTGLNFPLIQEAIGPEGLIVGVDRSSSMLAQAHRRALSHRWDNVELSDYDATTLRTGELAADDRLFDAAVATYTLSLMEHWRSAWETMLSLVRPGGRIAVVDLGYPGGRASTRVASTSGPVMCWSGSARKPPLSPEGHRRHHRTGRSDDHPATPTRHVSGDSSEPPVWFGHAPVLAHGTHGCRSPPTAAARHVGPAWQSRPRGASWISCPLRAIATQISRICADVMTQTYARCWVRVSSTRRTSSMPT